LVKHGLKPALSQIPKFGIVVVLVFIAKAPELCLEGITTVHGDTLLRAKIARIASKFWR